VTVAKANDVTNHGHDSRRPGVGLSDVPPLSGTSAGGPELASQEVAGCLSH